MRVAESDPTFALADIDGNGRLDLVAANERGETPGTNGDLVVLFNDGVNSFAKERATMPSARRRILSRSAI